MSFTFKWLQSIWLAHTAENMAIAFAGSLLDAMLHANVHELTAVDWPQALNRAGFEAMIFFFTAVVSRRVANGTASFNPRVVASKLRGTVVGIRERHTHREGRAS